MNEEIWRLKKEVKKSLLIEEFVADPEMLSKAREVLTKHNDIGAVYANFSLFDAKNGIYLRKKWLDIDNDISNDISNDADAKNDGFDLGCNHHRRKGIPLKKIGLHTLFLYSY